VDLGLRDRACIVTGASRGIGQATAALLLAEGAHVLLVGRGQPALTAAAEACRAAATEACRAAATEACRAAATEACRGAAAEACRGAAAEACAVSTPATALASTPGGAAQDGCGPGQADILALDVTDADAGERLVAACLERFDGLDVLVNNAGLSFVRPLELLTDEDWQAQWELHAMAPMRLMRAAAPVMAQRGWGRIVNVCSSSGKRPSQTNTAYSVTKAAELSLSRAFADAYASRGVLVNAVAPGPIATELWLAPGGLADQHAQAKGISRDDALAAAAARQPVGRLGTAQEVAAAIVFLCSEAAANVAGSAWSVDGGAVPVII
jgi:3-oxoacyl-[acyl-carrier protein] reductase